MKLRTALYCLFPYEQLLICAFHTFHFPQAFLTCLMFLTLVDWQRNGFWQNNTEVTDWFEKKHSVPAGGIRLFRSCFMTLHPGGPSPLQTELLPLSSQPPWLSSIHISTEINSVDDNPFRELSKALCWPLFSQAGNQQCILLQPSIHSSFTDSCHSPDSLSSPSHRMPQCTNSALTTAAWVL